MRTIDELGISPTPWCVDESEYGDRNNVLCNYVCDRLKIGEVRTKVVAGTNHHFENSQADARLIAAAPDCYEALAAVVSWYERNKPLPYEENGIQMIMDYAKKALAKASGEEVK